MIIDDEQRRFYSELYRAYGDDPRSLSWGDKVTQYERFDHLARIFPSRDAAFSVHEIGCGLGHFGDFLLERYPNASYSGSDVSAEFVEACRRKFPNSDFFLRNIVETVPTDRYDHLVISGTFDARLSATTTEWSDFVSGMIRSMYMLCRESISANFLTTFHDPAFAQSHLHYQSPAELIEFVVKELSRHYELDAGGPLYEYTLRLYRPETVRRRYSGPEFARYFQQ